jgi:hypothetical protein
VSIPFAKSVFLYQIDSLKNCDLIATDDHADIRGLIPEGFEIPERQVNKLCPFLIAADASGYTNSKLLKDIWSKEGSMVSFDVIWLRIEACAGEKFVQIRGGEFTYMVAGGHVIPDRTKQQIPKSNFEKASAFLPLENTVRVQDLRGPSYIYAILMDERISQGDW